MNKKLMASFFESSGLRVKENEKYICSATSNDSESTVTYLYREKDTSIYKLEHKSGLATSFHNGQKKNIDKETFNDKLNLCVMNLSI
ncbi:hypothetical protein [Vibrio sp. E150_018]